MVVVGAHVQGLLLNVEALPGSGESVIGWGFAEPADGGKSTNQAVAAARLGAPTVLVSVVGDDERGRRAVRYFADERIDVRFCATVDAPTDVGFVLLPPDGVPAIATALECNRALDAALVERAAPAIRAAGCVVCALEAPQEAAVAAFRLARAAGAATILNPAPAGTLDPELVALTDLLVPNEHEASALAGRDGGPGDLAEELARSLDLPQVVVTAGAAGAYVVTAGSPAQEVGAPSVEVVDTTGAGDAFVAALAVALVRGDSILEAARFAVRAASLSVTRPGTMPSYPTIDEVESSG